MKRKAMVCGWIAAALVLAAGCGGSKSKEAAKPVPQDRIQGKAQLLIEQGGASDAALNAGGENSVYLWDGTKRYRLFLKTAVEIVHGKEYVAEGVDAQKAIEEIGDPDMGKNGYPLQTSCERVVRRAWPNASFDSFDADVSLVRARVRRYPARSLFLVAKIRPATLEERKTTSVEEAKKVPEVTVAADKQKALLTAGQTVLPAPLWEPAGGTISCKVVIDTDGKVAELATGAQLCEAVPWEKFQYQPTLKAGKPVKVNTEVEIRFETRT